MTETNLDICYSHRGPLSSRRHLAHLTYGQSVELDELTLDGRCAAMLGSG